MLLTSSFFCHSFNLIFSLFNSLRFQGNDCDDILTSSGVLVGFLIKLFKNSAVCFNRSSFFSCLSFSFLSSSCFFSVDCFTFYDDECDTSSTSDSSAHTAFTLSSAAFVNLVEPSGTRL